MDSLTFLQSLWLRRPSAMGGEKLWWAWVTGARGTAANASLQGPFFSTWNESALREALNASGNASWPCDLETAAGLSEEDYALIVTILTATVLGFLILATIIGELSLAFLLRSMLKQ